MDYILGILLAFGLAGVLIYIASTGKMTEEEAASDPTPLIRKMAKNIGAMRDLSPSGQKAVLWFSIVLLGVGFVIMIFMP